MDRFSISKATSLSGLKQFLQSQGDEIFQRANPLLQEIEGYTAMNVDVSVTTMNWGTPPHNRWSFQHMTELFPCCRLIRGGSATLEFETVEKALHKIGYSGLDGSLRTVEQMLDDSYSDAFVVAHRGKIITEQYFNGMTLDSFHLLNSVTKSYVGMLAGIAVERGLLEPELPIVHYLPDLDNSAWTGATVRHLLDMTAGAQYVEDYADPETDFWKEASVVGWRPALVDESTPASLFDYARSLEGQDQENGSRFFYRTVTTNVLGMILESVMDDRLANLLTTEMWSKLGTKHDAFIVVDQSGFPYVGAGMNACARDLVNFGLVMINDGRFNETEVIPASWVEDTLRGSDSSKQCFADSEHGQMLSDWHYRNQVWVKDSDKGVMLAIGIHGQTIYMDKSNDLVIVKLSSQPESLDPDMFLDTFTAFDAIAEHLGEG